MLSSLRRSRGAARSLCCCDDSDRAKHCCVPRPTAWRPVEIRDSLQDATSLRPSIQDVPFPSKPASSCCDICCRQKSSPSEGTPPAILDRALMGRPHSAASDIHGTDAHLQFIRHFRHVLLLDARPPKRLPVVLVKTVSYSLRSPQKRLSLLFPIELH